MGCAGVINNTEEVVNIRPPHTVRICDVLTSVLQLRRCVLGKYFQSFITQFFSFTETGLLLLLYLSIRSCANATFQRKYSGRRADVVKIVLDWCKYCVLRCILRYIYTPCSYLSIIRKLFNLFRIGTMGNVDFQCTRIAQSSIEKFTV